MSSITNPFRHAADQNIMKSGKYLMHFWSCNYLSIRTLWRDNCIDEIISVMRSKMLCGPSATVFLLAAFRVKPEIQMLLDDWRNDEST